jgi:hypothetical protein
MHKLQVKMPALQQLRTMQQKPLQACKSSSAWAHLLLLMLPL